MILNANTKDKINTILERIPSLYGLEDTIRTALRQGKGLTREQEAYYITFMCSHNERYKYIKNKHKKERK